MLACAGPMQDPLASPLFPLAAGLVTLFVLGLWVASRVPAVARGQAARVVLTRVSTTTLVVTGLSLYLARQGMGAGNPFIRGVVQGFVSVASLSLVSVITMHHVGQIATRPAPAPASASSPSPISGRRVGLALVGIIVVLGAVLAAVAAHER